MHYQNRDYKFTQQIGMSLLNYTTKIDPDKTAQEIARCLSMHGAKAVLTEYDEKEGLVVAISFKISMDGRDLTFRLPCDWKPVWTILQNDPSIPRSHKDQTQAVRTAWRIVKDWVEAQMALVETKMVTTAQVFLPYAIMKNQKTLSENIAENPTLLLGNGESND